MTNLIFVLFLLSKVEEPDINESLGPEPTITPLVTTTTTEVFTEETEVPNTTDEYEERQNKCRADDVVRCADSSVTICADQECDGKKDCPNGEDEAHCSSGSGITIFFITNQSRCWDLIIFGFYNTRFIIIKTKPAKIINVTNKTSRFSFTI